MKPISIESIFNFVSSLAKIRGHRIKDFGALVHGFSSVYESENQTASWARDKKTDLREVKANLLIVGGEFNDDMVPLGIDFIAVENPRYVFAKIVRHYHPLEYGDGIHATAVVSKTATLGRKVSIGAYSIVEDDCTIGDDTVIGNHVVIKRATRIGNDCIIKSGAVIGEEGFGFDYEEDGSPFRIPHIGKVEIGSHVEIGSLTTVCRGTFGSTSIADFVKIDDHVHISHNVKIGERAMVIACAEISGSVTIGPDVWISPNASIIDKVTIGGKVIIGIGAVVTKSARDGEKLVGNRARPIGEAAKINRFIEGNIT